MNEVRALLLLELRSLYGINRCLHTRDKKEKNRYRLLSVAWLLLICMVFAYVAGLVYGLCSLELAAIVPAYLVMLASLVILAFGLFTAGNRIFGQQGYALLSALPVKTGSVVLSRFLSLYVEDLVLTLAVMLPGSLTYGWLLRPQPGFYLVAAVGSLCIPAVPMVISIVLGTVVTGAASRMKNKTLAQTALMLLVLAAVLGGSVYLGGSAESLTPEAFSQLAQTIGSVLGRLYPPALWLGSAMTGGRGLWRFVLVSAAVTALAFWLVERNFRSILRRLLSVRASHDYKLGAMGSRSLARALYVREARRYFASPIYVTNTIVGPIMGMVMAVALCVTGLEAVQGPLGVDITGLLPFALAAVFTLMTTSSVSISMEGRQIWVVKSLPIPTKAWLDSKILLNLSLMAPFYLVSVGAIAIATGPEPAQLVWLALIPAALMLFAVVWGITVNLKFHSFEWAKEEAVVKQSLPAALGGFSGFLLSLVLGGVVFVTPLAYGDLVRALLCLLIFGLTALLYQKNNRAELRCL